MAKYRLTSIDEAIAKLPAKERAAIEAEVTRLVAEEMTLRNVRKARDLTQERLAELMKIGQEGVSKLEQRSDLLLSTLRSYIEAMGGTLRLVVEFPDRAPVVLSGFSDNDEEERKKPRRSKQSATEHKPERKAA